MMEQALTLVRHDIKVNWVRFPKGNSNTVFLGQARNGLTQAIDFYKSFLGIRT